MKYKKKAPGRNLAGEHASPRVLRNQKKGTENVQNAEKKVADMITSSARKPRAGTLSNKTVDSDAATNLHMGYHLVQNVEANISLVYDTIDDASMDCKDFTRDTDNKMSESIFSPTFHIAKSVEGEIANGDLENCVNTMIPMKTHTTYSFCNEDLGTNMSSEVSSIYLAMKNSKLECVEEQSQDSLSADVCIEEAEYAEFEDFDPYLFIKNLPELSMVVPTFRPMLLPKQTRSCPSTTLVLDLDETLVHSTLEPCDDADFTFTVNFNLTEHTVYVRCRPYLKYFMERVAGLFEIIIFTASQSIYAEQLLNVLDPKRKVFRHRVFRESCVFFEGNYLKDLSVLGRDLARVIIIDNSPQAFGFQVDNGIPIESWFDESSDQELLSIIPFLESLVGVEDVRPLIAKKFNLREKITAAVYPSLELKRDPF